MANVSNVTSAKPGASGAIRRAVAGTTLPTDATTALAVAFKDLGYISEDGYTNSNNMEVNETKDWGGDIVDSEQTGKPDKFKFKLLEALNVEVLKAVYGDDNVDGTLSAGLTVTATSDAQEAAVWVIEEILKGGVVARTVIPKGVISSFSDVAHKAGEPIGYEIEITAMPDSTIGGTHKTYYKG